MRLLTSVLVAASASVPVAGLQGFGDQSTGYFLYCATACNRALGSNYLSCSFAGYVPSGMMDSDSASATLACRGSNMPFLSSLAYCISTHCNYDMGIIETWWAAKSTGSGGAFEPPRWSYQEALMNVTIAPTHVITAKDNLTSTMLANETNYRNQYGTLFMVDREEFLHEKYGLVLFMVGFGIPLLATWVGYLPFVSPLIYKLKPYSIWPSIIGSYRIRQLPFLGGTALTRGQALYVFIMVVLTVVFMAVHYESYQANLWYPGLSVELMAYVVWRIDCYSLALLPVVFLFSASNNTLLWLTHWSHETYILLHRWVARIFALLVIIHSVFSIVYYVKDGNYDVNLIEAWWIWGDDIVRIDIDNIHWRFQPGKVVYAYFPTLQPLHPWENHPCSVLPTAMLERSNGIATALDKDSSSSHGSGCQDDIEKTVVSQQKPVRQVASASEHQPTAGITLFIRKSTGFTKALAAGTNILTLLDGPYPGNPIAPISQCDRLLLVCGGIGITAILPWVDNHPNVKLAWSIKECASPLVDSVRKVLDRVIEKDVRIGHRLDIEDLLMEESQAGWKRIGVVVCGPDGMCDDTRALVTEMAKCGEAQFELEVHAYSW
ncbi:ferric reductase transmembrane component 3 [Trichoderma harzianum]|uniref:Ferric reductase transmembrane component 3 n=1 Tax=Trichoderma harzianum TaxID=5544 RepID=A0A0F9XNU3_TRIHA|nr:ferric reductase transmembrane component 3 [Trichoderma harzianum]